MLEEATTRFAPVLEKVTQNKTKQNKTKVLFREPFVCSAEYSIQSFRSLIEMKNDLIVDKIIDES